MTLELFSDVFEVKQEASALAPGAMLLRGLAARALRNSWRTSNASRPRHRFAS
jgi:hypothetical protein